MKRKREDELRVLTPREAQLLLERIFTRGYVPPQHLYDRYAQYSISKPGDEKARYPLTKSEFAKINKPRIGQSTHNALRHDPYPSQFSKPSIVISVIPPNAFLPKPKPHFCHNKLFLESL
jgi:hypothetical protein